jgi:hypothetical protein
VTSEYGRPDGYLLAGIAKEWKGRFEREQLPEVLNDTSRNQQKRSRCNDDYSLHGLSSLATLGREGGFPLYTRTRAEIGVLLYRRRARSNAGSV